MEDVCFVTFALFNVFWASVYTEQWRRRSAALAYKWGTLDKKNELLQDPRPLYTVSLSVIYSNFIYFIRFKKDFNITQTEF